MAEAMVDGLNATGSLAVLVAAIVHALDLVLSPSARRHRWSAIALVALITLRVCWRIHVGTL